MKSQSFITCHQNSECVCEVILYDTKWNPKVSLRVIKTQNVCVKLFCMELWDPPPLSPAPLPLPSLSLSMVAKKS